MDESKKGQLKVANDVDTCTLFSGSIRAGKSYGYVPTLETHSNCTFPTVRTFTGFIVVCEPQKEKTMDNELKEQLKGKRVRIRTITEREGFRLMGVDDADIDKIQGSGVSYTAQRKLAGNSIVVDVLFNIFRKMFIEKGNENQQLTLF